MEDVKSLKIYSISVKTYLLQNIKLKECNTEISSLVDRAFLDDEEYKEFHKETKFKHYSLGGFTPVERDRVFKKGELYSFEIRTPNKKLADYLAKRLFTLYTPKIKVLVAEISVIPRNYIEKIYTLTPAIAKFNEGYWRNKISFDIYEERIKSNLIKKYNDFTGNKIDGNFILYERIEFNNKYPIPIEYKSIRLLGDKVTLYLGNSEIAQELAYFALGVGILEMNPRMCGFVGYKYL